ncbi:arrestin domain-containing protein 17-like [Littorina saxatilis]|uniref:Arrestin C-terminal-like domain-containing protein n=1 Tax=Littorina saxatilis TaxID=31220 RepID=A0AAN9C223_9CAEN
MGKIKTFEILVDNPGSTVKAGDSVRGQVLLELSEDVELNEIRVSFTGRCRIQWAEAQKAAPMSEIQSTALDPVVAEEVYVNDFITLFPRTRAGMRGHRKYSKTTLLSKGTHTFNFEFPVPETVSSSFSGNHGYVKYTLKAVVERPWKIDVNTRGIIVESDLDLNNVPGASDSVSVSDDLKITTLLFPSGECNATVRLARKGFLPGDTIPVEFRIHNNSHHEIHKVSLNLKRVVIYKADKRKCTSETILCKSHLGKIPAEKTFEGLHRKLRVPITCLPSGLPGCRLINIKYILELKIKPSLLSLKRLKLHTPIIIGTKDLDCTTYFDSPPDYESCCPPSYEDVLASSSQPLSPTSPSPFSCPFPSLQEPPSPVSPQTSSPWNQDEDDPTPRRFSNVEPRMTVLRQISSPSTEEVESICPPVRPRAHTTSSHDMTHKRGSWLVAPQKEGGTSEEQDLMGSIESLHCM